MTKLDEKYVNLLTRILDEGVETDDRTGVGTRAITNTMIEHDMSDGFPLLTVKHVGWKTIFGELEFFLKGRHRKEWFHNHPANITIWDDWCDPTLVNYAGAGESVDKKQSEHTELGPVYGYQWRGFNRPYTPYALSDMYTDEQQEDLEKLHILAEKFGIRLDVDQLENVVNDLKIGKQSRRMYVTSMNPSMKHHQALEPCHTEWQVVRRGDKIDLTFHMRSSDVFLGLPFNIASYGLLLELLAHEVGAKAGKLCYFGVDVHIYKNHTGAINKLLGNYEYGNSYIYPKLVINDSFKSVLEFDSTKDVEIVDYKHMGSIKADVAV